MRSKLETEKEKAVAIKKHKFLMFLIKKKLVVQLAAKSLNSSKICEEKIFFFHNLKFFHVCHV